MKDLYINNNNINLNMNNNMLVNLSKISISNGANELISTLIELVEKIIIERHVGDPGTGTSLRPDSVINFQNIKAKLETFKL
jgi:hypothetical protein